MTRIAILLLRACLPARPAVATGLLEGSAFVVDGDTIEVQNQRIRLWGIDAPELAQICTEGGRRYPCGLDASQALRKRIGRQPVNCIHRDNDRYGRMVAICRSAGADLGQWMVQQGQALAYRKYSLDYVADEDRARAAKIGIWAGAFQDPAEHRHQPRRPPVAARGRRRACNCPDDTDRAGRRCGGRSAYSRVGGSKSACAAGH